METGFIVLATLVPVVALLALYIKALVLKGTFDETLDGTERKL